MDSTDLAGVLTAFAASMADLAPRSLQRMRPIAVARQPRTHLQCRDHLWRKIDRQLDAARVGPGSRVLGIGTGRGERCIRAALRGASVRSVTLSAEQQRLARRRVAPAGLARVVDIDLCDYRDVDRGLRRSDVRRDDRAADAFADGKDRGLWAWTGHPHYFGTVLFPVLMRYYLVYATGARPTEKLMASRPDFDEYRSRTSFFVPVPPRVRTG
ncbi:MAG: class I SAM-dependent methyltransferase [Mycobacterium sp.]